MMTPLRAERLVQRYGDIQVVAGISLSIVRAESIAIVGPSGSGKTTLLQMLGLLDRPKSGQVFVDGVDAWALGSAKRARLRLEKMGFVFQQHGLLGHLTAAENVALPAWRRGVSKQNAIHHAHALLDRFGLASFSATRAALLSMGQAQRVAIARAIINRPSVVLADEPTGSLDSISAQQVLNALDEIREEGTALLVATHDSLVASRSHRRITLRDGQLIE